MFTPISQGLSPGCVSDLERTFYWKVVFGKVLAMAERFVEVDRNTPMLLPADLRDWVPEDDLVHFVIEAVRTLPSGQFVVNERRRGYAHYPPSMMLALLIYCYANGIFSSRRIERATYRDLGVRFLTGDPIRIMTPSAAFGARTRR